MHRFYASVLWFITLKPKVITTNTEVTFSYPSVLLPRFMRSLRTQKPNHPKTEPLKPRAIKSLIDSPHPPYTVRAEIRNQIDILKLWKFYKKMFHVLCQKYPHRGKIKNKTKICCNYFDIHMLLFPKSAVVDIHSQCQLAALFHLSTSTGCTLPAG